MAYGVEHPKLGNEIRSVEPTILGGASALVCYPPIQPVSLAILRWYPLERPDYETFELQLAIGLGMFGLMGHLMADPDYRAYCERVKWRYVPGV